MLLSACNYNAGRCVEDLYLAKKQTYGKLATTHITNIANEKFLDINTLDLPCWTMQMWSIGMILIIWLLKNSSIM